MSEAVGVDVGGTKIAAMRVGPEGAILERVQEPTPVGDSAEAVLAAVESAAAAVIRPGVSVVGVGVPGLVEFATGILRFAPNLPFRDLPLKARLERATGLPCQVDNDANVAAWAEFRMGAGRGSTDMLLVTVGTGIGGGIVSGGRMLRGSHGFAAEIGHFIVEPGGPLCGCGNRGCWEQVASGRAIGRLGREAAARDPGSLLATMAGGDPAQVSGLVVTGAALRGDPVAVGILAQVGGRLGEGIAGLVNILDTEVVVVGGGAVAAGELLLGPAREVFQRTIEAPDHRPKVPLVAAQMGNDAGAVGAALLALDELVGVGRGAP
ncbi:MAG: ROK family protein [Actinomycetota bacterium]|nr:ROK family protein [Actinomycetota bacterium]